MSYFRNLPWYKFGFSLLGLALLVSIISLFWSRNEVIFALLLLASLIIFLRPHRKSTDIIPFLIGAIFGPAMEMVIIHFGGWQYNNPSFGGIPVWLPLLWGLTGFFFLKMTVWLMPRKEPKASAL